MKKTLIGGLALSVLALGAVAGAVSARHAEEVKADTLEYVYVKFGEDSAWKKWNAGSANTKIHFFGGYETTWPGNDVSEVTIDDVLYFKAEVPTGATQMLVNVWGGGTDQNKTEDLTIPTDGKNLFTVTSAKTTNSRASIRRRAFGMEAMASLPPIRLGKNLRFWTVEISKS